MAKQERSEKRAAIISPDGKYRYTLERIWDDKLPLVLWIMLNPSTANAFLDDPTIRRCRGFTQTWRHQVDGHGFGGFLVGNLYAYRATYPVALKMTHDPVGPDNDETLHSLASRSSLIVCAWGRPGPQPDRVAQVLKILRTYNLVHTLGFTKPGEPRHPLMLKKDLSPAVW